MYKTYGLKLHKNRVTIENCENEKVIEVSVCDNSPNIGKKISEVLNYLWEKRKRQIVEILRDRDNDCWWLITVQSEHISHTYRTYKLILHKNREAIENCENEIVMEVPVHNDSSSIGKKLSRALNYLWEKRKRQIVGILRDRDNDCWWLITV